VSQNRKRLPPSTRGGTPLYGPDIESFTVGSWCPTPDGTGPATAVAISIRPASHQHDIVMRLKSPAAVDRMIQMLLRHKRDVWPDAP